MRSLLFTFVLVLSCIPLSAQRFIKVVDSIAALSASNPNDVHTNVLVTGYSTANDGGGGIFTFNRSSTATVDGGTVFLTTGTGRWIRQRDGDIWSILWFGASTNSSDNGGFIQAALDAIHANGGGTLLVPEGIFISDRITAYSNTQIIGISRDGSIIKQMSGATDDILFTVNTDTGGSTDVANNVTNVYVSNLTFRGRSDSDGFSQFKHLVGVSAASRVTFERVNFIGPQGDGAYLGSSLDGSAERHNEDIIFRECLFDGINNANRNGISIIDGTRVSIYDCIFQNLTTTTEPGPIDIEPNDHAYSRIRNISIDNCVFTNNRPNVANIAVALPRSQATMDIPAHSISITRCKIDGNFGGTPKIGIKVTQPGTITDDTPPLDVYLAGNEISNTSLPVYSFGVNQFTIEGRNVFDTSSSELAFGSTGPEQSVNVTIRGNVFRNIATNATPGIALYNFENFTFQNNDVNEMGNLNGSSGNVIRLQPNSTSSGFRYQDNRVRGSRLTKIIGKATTHTNDPTREIVFAEQMYDNTAFDIDPTFFVHSLGGLSSRWAGFGTQPFLTNYILQTYGDSPTWVSKNTSNTNEWSLQQGRVNPATAWLFRHTAHDTIPLQLMTNGTIVSGDHTIMGAGPRLIHSNTVSGLEWSWDTGNFDATSYAVRMATHGLTPLLIQTNGTVAARYRVDVGQSGETGVIEISSTNGTHVLALSLLADGTLTLTNDGVLVDSLALSSGYAGGGTKVKHDDGTYKAVIYPPGASVTNININPTDGFLPYRSNSTTFGDSPLAVGTNAWYAKFGSTYSFLVNSNSGFSGAGTKDLADDGTFKIRTNYVTIALANPNVTVTTGNTNFWVAPEACTIKTVTAHLLVPSSSGSVTIELKKNGTTVLSSAVSLTSGTTNATASVSVTGVTAFDRLAGEITAAGTTAYGPQLKIGYTIP